MINMPTVVTWRGIKVKVLSGVKKEEMEEFYCKNPFPSAESIRNMAKKIRHPLAILETWLKNRANGGRIHSCCIGCPTYFTFDTNKVMQRDCHLNRIRPVQRKPVKRKCPTDLNNNTPNKKIKVSQLSTTQHSARSNPKQKSTSIPAGLNLKEMQPVVVLRRLDLWCFRADCERCASREFLI